MIRDMLGKEIDGRAFARTLFGWCVAGVVMFPFAVILSSLRPDRMPQWVAVVVLMTLGGAFIRFVGLALFRGVMLLLGPILTPSGRSSPYAYDFSREQALVASGDVVTALALYEQH